MRRSRRAFLGRVVAAALVANAVVATVLVVLLVSGNAESVDMGAPIMPERLALEPDSIHWRADEHSRAREAAEELTRLLATERAAGFAAFDSEFALERWVREHDVSAEVTVHVRKLYAMTEVGALVDLQVRATAASERRRQTLHNAFLEWGESPRVRFRVPHEAVAAAGGDRVRVTTWVDPRRRWTVSEVTVSVESEASMVVFQAPPVRASSGRFSRKTYDRGARLVAVTQDGAPCDFRLTGAYLVVQLRRSGPGAKVRFRLEGALDAAGAFYSEDGVLLSEWYPRVAGTAPAVDLTLVTPEGFDVMGLGAPTEHEAVADGWIRRRWARPVGVRPAAVRVASPLAGGKQVRGGELVVTVHGDGDGLVSEAVEVGLELLAPLGPPASGDVDVVIAPWRGNGRGVVFAEDDVMIRESPALRRWGVAFDLASLWFGDDVLDPRDGSASPAAAVAAYVGLRAAGDGAAALRRLLADKDTSTVALTDAVLDHPAAVPRGGALLALLGDRVGTAAMDELLLRLYRAHRGDSMTWDDVVAVVDQVSGAEDASWLRARLGLPRVVELELAVEGSVP